MGEKVRSDDPEFKQFENMAWGYRAMFVLLNTYEKKYGLGTIERIISRYAPDTENNTKAYVEFVAGRAGISKNQRIDTGDEAVMMPVVAAMSRMENGIEPDIKAVGKGWELFKKHKP